MRSSSNDAHRVRAARPHAEALGVLLERLGSDAERGLDAARAAERLAEVGANELQRAPPRPVWRVMLSQFNDVAVIALMVAAAIAVALAQLEGDGASMLERYGDAIAIGIIVVLNATVGFVQERKAEAALTALRALGAPEARVVRAGTTLRVAARTLVPGDLLLLEEGDRVAADARLVESHDLVTTEAALTGESAPTDKEVVELEDQTALADRRNMVFLGTHVVRGKARALVVGTAGETELGRIATLLGQVDSPDTPLQISLRRFSTWVVVGASVLAGLVLLIGIWRKTAPLGEWLLTAVSLAVAAIPEGLPAITTIVLALGVQRMAGRNALVRRLSAVETLGSADVVCTDKTGTLTQNSMEVRRLALDGAELSVRQQQELEILDDAGGRHEGAEGDGLSALIEGLGFAPAATLQDGVVSGDPTDAALLGLHARARPEGERASDRFRVLRALPFERERGRASVIAERDGQVFAFTHGAAERVLEHCSELVELSGRVRTINDDDRASCERLIGSWGDRGLRVLSVARRVRARSDDEPPSSRSRAGLIEEFERDMTLLGLVGLADPPRPEVRDAIATAARAGVRTIMITGDHPRTASAIAAELGIVSAPAGAHPSALLTGADIEQSSRERLQAVASEVVVVARATAEHKLALIEALQARGHVVAMTGDGVNDAPAIKASNIGVAMGRGGTDVTREAADMVLLDDNYATIVAAIAEGRAVYANIKRFVVFLFAVNWGLVLAVLVGALLGWPALLTPTQILWINLITNGLPALALGMEPSASDPMSNPPRRRDAALVSRGEVGYILAYGTVIGLLGIGAFVYFGGAATGAHLPLARTAAFSVLAIAPLFHALSARSRDDSVFRLGFFGNGRLLAAFGVALGLQALAVYMPGLGGVFGTVPLTAGLASALLGISASVWVVGELHKLIARWSRAPNRPLS
ncbi:MAG: cation-transporting P-type ATPase [Polyangiaceae bacterium]|nr:cation-transporting P-type ATPase [Polyangiaceae bacterium]